jgi:hypothetical protein
MTKPVRVPESLYSRLLDAAYLKTKLTGKKCYLGEILTDALETPLEKEIERLERGMAK